MTADEAHFLSDEELAAAIEQVTTDMLVLGRERARRRMDELRAEADARPVAWKPWHDQLDHEEGIEEMSLGGRTFRERR